jgi:hypothetical protein
MWTLAVTVWVAVVIAGSALTWLAIDRAGQQVTGSPTASETQPPVVGTIGPAPISTASPSSRHSGGTPRSSGPAAPTSASPTARATSAVPTKRPSSSATKTSSVAPRTVTRTWTGAAGFVTVTCSGAQATLKGASPADGWSYEPGDESGDSVEVKFSNGTTEVQVRGSCVGGTPQFTVESGSSSDD